MTDLGVNTAARARSVDSGAPLTQANPLQGDVFIGDKQEASTPIEMIFADDTIGNRCCLLSLQLRAVDLNAASPPRFALKPE